MACSESPDTREFNPESPFKGIVVCTTSLSADHRADVKDKTTQMGGVLKFDLTPDVTHLLTGHYDTPKYRHVAKDRLDIKVMDPRWIDHVMKLWVEDGDIDMAALEEQFRLKPLQTGGCSPTDPQDKPRGSLICCITGFADYAERQKIVDMVESNGGIYTGDLSRQVTHLIVHKPEGKKYQAARDWGIQTVSLEWLQQTCERGLVLEEALFNPLKPPEERGVGAWSRTAPKRNSLGKRLRNDPASTTEDGQRKLRKTASLRLGHQTKTMWDDILQKQPTPETSLVDTEPLPTKVQGQLPDLRPGVPPATKPAVPDADDGIFSSSYFCLAGFNQAHSDVLNRVLISLGAATFAYLDDLTQAQAPQEPWNRFLIVPQTLPPDQYPRVNANNYRIVTEFFVEKCLHHKTLFDPEESVLGRPFPVFPVKGFERHSVCTSGFLDVALLHVEKSIKQLGGQFCPRLNQKTTVLLTESLETLRKDKRSYAQDRGIPIVSADWLWRCISTGGDLPLEPYMYSELRQKRPRKDDEPSSRTERPTQRALANPASHPVKLEPLDKTAFEDDQPAPTKKAELKPVTKKQPSDASTHFETARTHQEDGFGGGHISAPLSEVSDKALNRSPSPKKASKEETRSMAPSPPTRTAKDRTLSVEDADATPKPEVSTVANEEESRTVVAEARKRRLREERAAERQLFTSKLTHLIDVATTESSAEPKSGHSVGPRRERRKREIFGRAISNISAGSSGSLDVSAKLPDAGLGDSGLQLSGDGKDEEEARPPPATQLNWKDPDGEQYRRGIIERLMSADGGASSSPGPADEPPMARVHSAPPPMATMSTKRQTRRNF